MTRQMVGDVGAGHFIALGRLARDGDNFDERAASEERQGVGGSTRRATAAIPAQQDAIKLELRSLNVRNDQHLPAGVEERRLDDQPIKGGLLRLRLTKDRQVEPARKTGENAGSCRDGRVKHTRFRRNARVA